MDRPPDKGPVRGFSSMHGEHSVSKDNGTKTAEPTTPRLIDFVTNATAADLAEIDQEIATVRGPIDQEVGALRGQLSALQALRKVIDLKVNGKKAKGTGQKATNAAAKTAFHNGQRAKVAALLGKEGPLLASVISNRLGIPDGRALIPVLKCDWFEATSSGYRLTSIGRREAQLVA